jgi:hypothetical protein
MNVPCSATPAGPLRSATATLWYRLPLNGQRRLPRQILISGLNHTARSFAVYASQDGLLHRHARLASGWLAILSGRDWLPAGSQMKGFRSPHPPFPSFSWRTRFTVSKSRRTGALLVRRFAAGRAPSMAAIGQHEGVSKRYVSRLIRLGLPAPVIVDRIAECAQAPMSLRSRC